jgi:hypothetical protein
MRQLLCIFIVALISAASIARADLTLVKEGKAMTNISIPPSPTASQQLAAEEFVKYVKQMTGVTLTVGEGGLQIGSLEEAYWMLDEMGCRFLSPQYDFYKGAGEIIPTNVSTLSLPDAKFPAAKLPIRKLYVEEGHSHTVENLKQMIQWMPKVGYNTLVVPMNYQGHGKVMWDNWRDALTPELQKRGITIEVGGHGYQNFLNADMEGGKLFDQHPEWFGLDKTGQRRRESNYVFCTSNAAAMNYFINHFAAYIQAHPEIQVYDFWPPDVARWCECDECKKLGSPSDRQAILLKQIADRIKQVKPDLRLEMIAYSAAIDPPENQTIDKNILVDFCPIDQQFEFQINDPAAGKNAAYVAQLKAWRSKFAGNISIYSYYRKYAWDSLPVELPHYLQKDLQFYQSVPVNGVSTYSEPGDWGTYELNHYMLAALARNPDADVDALEKKFSEARYGPASPDAIAAINSLEQIVRSDCAIPNSTMKSADEIDRAMQAIDKSSAIIKQDEAKADADGYRAALSRLDAMQGYAQRDLAIQKLRASNATQDEIRTQVESLQAWMAEHKDEGVFLVSDQRASITRMLRRYGIEEAK